MAQGDDEARTTPALVFCFNREECWTVAEQLKGKRVLERRPAEAAGRPNWSSYDWSEGAGPKLKQLLMRGVGVHHAGVLPKYRRIVEELFQRKLLSVAVCTETLSAGINLPARSVVRAEHHERPAGQEEAARSQHGPSDFRPGRPAAVRQGRARLRAGPRGRREDRPLAREVRPDSRGHERPGPDEGEEGAEEEDAHAPGERAVLERGPVPQALRGPAGQAATAAARCPGGCWPTCSTPRPRSTSSAAWSASG